MFHQTRTWSLGSVPTSQELAQKLTNHTWCLCTAFFVQGHESYLFLSDATHEDGAGEWAVVKQMIGGFMQVESITFSWCDLPKAFDYIERALRGEFDSQ